jgi:hypothetical protein
LLNVDFPATARNLRHGLVPGHSFCIQSLFSGQFSGNPDQEFSLMAVVTRDLVVKASFISAGSIRFSTIDDDCGCASLDGRMRESLIFVSAEVRVQALSAVGVDSGIS